MTHMPDMPDNRAVSLMAVDQYFRAVRWNERLSEEEEAKYLERVVRGFAERSKSTSNHWVLSLARDARDHLVESYQGFVVHVAKRYQHRFTHFHLLDVIQEGNIGLLAAFDTYAASPETPFPLVALTSIRRAIWHSLHEGESELALHTSRVKTTLNKLSRFQKQFFRLNGCMPEPDEIAEALNLPSHEVRSLLDLHQYEHLSSMQQMQTDKNGSAWERDFVSLFASSVQAQKEHDASLQQALDLAMQTVLSQKQKEVVCLHYGLEESEPHYQTYIDLASTLGITPQSVRVTNVKALQHLSAVLQVGTNGRSVVCDLPKVERGDYYTTMQAAACLQVSTPTILNYIHSDLLPAEKYLPPNGFREEYRLPKQGVESFLSSFLARSTDAFMETHYTITEAAKRLGIGRSTVIYRIKVHKLPVQVACHKKTKKPVYLVPKHVVESLVSADIPAIVA